MNSTFLIINQIRIPENNEWVIFILLGCAFIYIFMMLWLQRDSSVKEFLFQEFTVSANNLLSWVITSLVFSLLAATLFSQYIPTVPEFISKRDLFGFQLNKFGYTFTVLILFYFIKSVFTYFYYQATGSGRKWAVFYFTTTKLYFIWSLVLIGVCIMHYYFAVNRKEAFPFYILFFAIIFIFKLFYYIFHRSKILPKEWYYKFLYICTLQIIPILVLWKLLFF